MYFTYYVIHTSTVLIYKTKYKKNIINLKTNKYTCTINKIFPQHRPELKVFFSLFMSAYLYFLFYLFIFIFIVQPHTWQRTLDKTVLGIFRLSFPAINNIFNIFLYVKQFFVYIDIKIVLEY